MKTIYIDVYFLINFTVDLLALFFSSSFMRIPTNTLRLVISALIGALYAVVGILFISARYITVIFSLIILLLIMLIAAPRVGFVRKAKHLTAFLVFQILIGGTVYLGYCLLNRYFDSDAAESLEAGNRKLLVLSVLVLLTVGAIKLIIASFEKSTTDESISLTVRLGENYIELEALVDSGNLARDPFDGTPVMFVSAEIFKRICGANASHDAFELSKSPHLKKRMRIIPITASGDKKIVYALKCDEVLAMKKGKREAISVLVAEYPEQKSFGGFTALLPLSAIRNI